MSLYQDQNDQFADRMNLTERLFPQPVHDTRRIYPQAQFVYANAWVFKSSRIYWSCICVHTQHPIATIKNTTSNRFTLDLNLLCGVSSYAYLVLNKPNSIPSFQLCPCSMAFTATTLVAPVEHASPEVKSPDPFTWNPGNTAVDCFLRSFTLWSTAFLSSCVNQAELLLTSTWCLSDRNPN